ncbi:hypothetical protein D3C81_1372540 [compost metagenome]
MDRVRQVDADAAMYVLCDMADAMPRFTGHPRGGQGFAGRRQTGIDAVGQLPQHGAQGFDGDMGVGHAHLHRLEAADAALELPALADIGHGAADLLFTEPQLQGCQCRCAAQLQPGDGLGRQQRGSVHGQAFDMQVGHRFPVSQHRRHPLYLGRRQVEQQQARLPLGLHQHQCGAGLVTQGQRRDPAIDRPAPGIRLCLQLNAPGTAQAIDGQAQQCLAGRRFGHPPGTVASIKTGQSRGRQLMTPQWHLGQGLALGLQDQHQFGHAQTAAAVFFGNRQGM